MKAGQSRSLHCFYREQSYHKTVSCPSHKACANPVRTILWAAYAIAGRLSDFGKNLTNRFLFLRECVIVSKKGKIHGGNIIC